MELSVVRDAESWEQLAPAWNALLERSFQRVPFLRYEFLRAWWETLGGGEWPDGALEIVIARSADGGLSAAAPLFRTSAETTTLRLVGTTEIADYLDVLAEPGDLDRFARALLAWIAREAPAIEVVDLWNLADNSPSLAAFRGAADGAGWSADQAALKPSPRASLEGGWDGYLARLDKKQRHELRRKMRRAEAHPEGVRTVRAGAEIEIGPAVETLFGLMEHDPEKRSFLTPSMRRAFHAVAEAAAAGGWLRLEFLAVGGKLAAGVFAFDYDSWLWLYNSGLNPEYQALSAGWVLLGHMIREAAGTGRRGFDFLRGGEDYKYRLGGQERRIERLTLRR